MTERSTTLPNPVDQELVITRLFDAPRDLVFQAWTDPARTVQWLGPRAYPAAHVEQDVRPGGRWRACLRSEDGEELWHGGVYREVVAPERLAFTFAWDDPEGRPVHETLVTVTLAAQGGQTKMTFTQAPFPSVEQRDGHQGGWNSTFDRLTEFLN